jgi:hypothetical protein
MTFDVRNLTEEERAQLSELLAPYMEQKQQAERLIAAVGKAFLTALGFPPNLHVNLDTGEVTMRGVSALLASPNGATPAVPEPVRS